MTAGVNELKLSYEELLNPKSRVMPILSPRYFPIHPKVYDSDFAYTPDFVNRILTGLEASIDLDAEAIQKTLGRKLSYEKQSMEQWLVLANPQKRSVEFGFMGSNIAVQPHSYGEWIITDYSYLPPGMARERAMIFSRKPNGLEIPSWYTHTPAENGNDVFLYLRNFAILFNNLGVERIKA